jgi:hypothetical protein
VNNESRRIATVPKRSGWLGLPKPYPPVQALGAAIAILGTALLLAVLGIPASSGRANNVQCLEAFANDTHHSLEELLQDPALQDSLVQAIDQCSR